MSDRPLWAVVVHAGLVAVLVAVVTSWLSNARRPAKRSGDARILAYPVATVFAATLPIGICVVIAVVCWVYAKPDEWWVAWSFLGFGLLGAPTVADAFRVRHELSRDGIRYRGLVYRHPHVAWQEIDAARWSAPMKWLLVTTRDGRTLRFSALLNGLDALAFALNEHVPALRTDEVTAAMLVDARQGKLPSVWQ